MQIDRTGGLKLFSTVGKISAFIADRTSPVRGHMVPTFGNRMNSGGSLRDFSSDAIMGSVVNVAVFFISVGIWVSYDHEHNRLKGSQRGSAPLQNPCCNGVRMDDAGF